VVHRQIHKKKERSWEANEEELKIDLKAVEGEVSLNQVDDQIKVLDNILD